MLCSNLATFINRTDELMCTWTAMQCDWGCLQCNNDFEVCHYSRHMSSSTEDR